MKYNDVKNTIGISCPCCPVERLSLIYNSQTSTVRIQIACNGFYEWMISPVISISLVYNVCTDPNILTAQAFRKVGYLNMLQVLWSTRVSN